MKNIPLLDFYCLENLYLKQLFRIMRISMFLLFFCIFSLTAGNVNSQNAKVTINCQNVKLEAILAEIEAQTNYLFIYKENVDVSLYKSIQVDDMPVSEVLSTLLQDSSISYKMEGDHIILVQKKMVKKQLQQEISGVVIDKIGAPLVGVTVMVKNTSKGTVTNGDGKFTISAKIGNILQFSYIGYTSQEIKLENFKSLQIVLEEDVKVLEEIVVVGYGTQKKVDLTGALASIGAKEIAQVPVTTSTQALQGRIPGVFVRKTNNAPGSIPAVLIRGTRSITASNDPLYVVDGIPITAAFNELNPGDIESIDVLKDASATAIYGARGANGVVLVTTKRGKSGKAQVDYNGYMGVQTVQNRLELMNGGEYVNYVRESYRASGAYDSNVPVKELDFNIIPAFGGNMKDPHGVPADAYTWESIAMAYDADGVFHPELVRTSSAWWEEVERVGMITDHQMNVRGGTDKTQYMFGLNFHKNNGIYKDQDYQRFTVRLNLDQEVNNWLKIGAQTQYSQSKQAAGVGLHNNWKVSPIGRYYDDDGELLEMVSGQEIQFWNPLQYLEKNSIVRDRKTNRFLGSFYGEVKLPLKGLRYRLNVGLDFISKQIYDFTASNANYGGLNNAKNGTSQEYAYTIENLLFYDKTFGEHSIGATLLQSVQRDSRDENNIPVQNLPIDDLLYYYTQSALLPEKASSNHVVWSMASFMGRINYNFQRKYYATLSVRYDGSSRLAVGHKWVSFPAVALAWRINEEAFLKECSWVDNLKLRLGYGVTANSAISPYQTKGTLDSKTYIFGDEIAIGYAPSVLPNRALTWEKTGQWNLGIDFGIFKGCLSGTIELYLQNTSDLLLNRRLPIVSGFSDIVSNVGKTHNQGIEVSLTSRNINTKDFTWNTTFMLNANKDKIVELYNGKIDDIGSNWFIGESIGIYYDYKKIGIWQDTPEDKAEMEKFNAKGADFVPGSIKLKDVNGDYKITAEEDRMILGQKRPKLYGSFINDFRYKNIDLSIFFYGNYGGMLRNNIRYGHQALKNNNVKYDYWTPENPTNKFPRPNASKDVSYEQSLYYEKSDFLRIRTITLGYTLPQKVLGKAGMKKCRIYATAENPFIWTNYTGIDPDGVIGYGAPSVSSWILGVNLSF